MARARLLKPGFFTNDELAELPMAARLLFAGLWTLADRAGRLEDRPKRIKAEVLPYDDVDVDAFLTSLAERDFVVRYEVGGIRYLQVTNFGKHQSPHVREPESAIPAPDEHHASTVLAPDEHHATTASRAHSPIPHSPFPIPVADTEADTELTPRGAADEPQSSEDPQVISTMGEVTDERPHPMVTAYCKAVGSDITKLDPKFISGQRAVAKRLIERGYSTEKVLACIGYRQSQTWRDDPFDLFDIEKGIGKWEANGSPARASPNGKNGHVDRAHYSAPVGGSITGKLARS